MAIRKEEKIFDDFIKGKGLKYSEQRRQVLRAFLKTEKHLTAEDLHLLVKKRFPTIGIATVYRTLKLLRESGLCRELKFDDGTTRYEHLYGHEHHDHLICTECGGLTEVMESEIEKLQERLAKRNGFKIKSHKLEIYGTCKKCR
jgi:Fur family ferric uptake transcriptional regulator